MDKVTVLNFLEKVSTLPTLVTVGRTTRSKYLFYLVVGAYRRKTKLRPQFIEYSKAGASKTKGLIEEHALPGFSEHNLFVLEGFGRRFVESLRFPEGTWVLAETDEGEYLTPNYEKKYRRDILIVLMNQLSLGGQVTLTDLKKLDWTECRNYEDFEPPLRLAKIMGWTADRLQAHLISYEQGNLLTGIKRADYGNIFALAEKYSARTVYNRLIKRAGQLGHFKALINMGWEESRIARELELTYWERKELAEAHRMITGEELTQLIERIIRLDWLCTRSPELGVDLLVLNMPFRMRRRPAKSA